MKIKGVEPLYPIVQQYATNNPCFKQNVQITVTGLVLHSIGCNQPSADKMAQRWNRSEAENAISIVCDDTHAIVLLKTFETPGKATKNWGVGKGSSGYSNNNCTCQLEMCESKWNIYQGGSTFTVDKAHYQALEYTRKCLDVAIETLAFVAFFHNIDCLGKDKRGHFNIMDHIGCNKVGVGSAHGDVQHLGKVYKEIDFDMATIRKRINDRVEELKLEKELNEMTDQQFETLMNRYLANQAKQKELFLFY